MESVDQRFRPVPGPRQRRHGYRYRDRGALRRREWSAAGARCPRDWSVTGAQCPRAVHELSCRRGVGDVGELRRSRTAVIRGVRRYHATGILWSQGSRLAPIVIDRLQYGRPSKTCNRREADRRAVLNDSEPSRGIVTGHRRCTTRRSPTFAPPHRDAAGGTPIEKQSDCPTRERKPSRVATARLLSGRGQPSLASKLTSSSPANSKSSRSPENR